MVKLVSGHLESDAQIDAVLAERDENVLNVRVKVLRKQSMVSF